MAKTKRDKKLYGRLRARGLRKKVARSLSELPAHASKGRAPKPLRASVDRLEGAVKELKGHTTRGARKAGAGKAARTRGKKATARSASGRKAARTRAKR